MARYRHGINYSQKVRNRTVWNCSMLLLKYNARRSYSALYILPWLSWWAYNLCFLYGHWNIIKPPAWACLSILVGTWSYWPNAECLWFLSFLLFAFFCPVQTMAGGCLYTKLSLMTLPWAGQATDSNYAFEVNESKDDQVLQPGDSIIEIGFFLSHYDYIFSKV